MTDLNKRISAYLKNLPPKLSDSAWARLLRECQLKLSKQTVIVRGIEMNVSEFDPREKK